jgi:hypothetical protein
LRKNPQCFINYFQSNLKILSGGLEVLTSIFGEAVHDIRYNDRTAADPFVVRGLGEAPMGAQRTRPTEAPGISRFYR